MSLSWKPIRSGNEYCAPACGHSCSYSEFKKATEQANELCKKLGNEFKPRVWENIGWHYEAYNGGISISPAKSDSSYGATYENREWFYAAGPKAALRTLQKWAERQRDSGIKIHQEISKAISGK